MAKTSLGQRLRHLREDLGYTQEHVSNQLNVERQTYTNYENGYRNPPLDCLIKLSDLYSTSIDYLVRGIPKPPKEPPLEGLERELLNNFNRLNPSNKKELQDYIRFKLSYQETPSN